MTPQIATRDVGFSRQGARSRGIGQSSLDGTRLKS